MQANGLETSLPVVHKAWLLQMETLGLCVGMYGSTYTHFITLRVLTLECILLLTEYHISSFTHWITQ